MGTRGAVGFRSENQDRVQYNHFDSYPSGLGHDVLTFISKTNMEELKNIANNIELINEDDVPTENQINACQKWTDLTVGEGTVESWYCLLRNAQGNLNAYKDGLKYMLDAQSFLLDSLFCEYAYIINVDTKKLEFYCGFNEVSRNRMGRYAKLQLEKGRPYNYYGVVLVKEFELEEIMNASDEKIAEMVKIMDKKTSAFRSRQKREMKKEKEFA